MNNEEKKEGELNLNYDRIKWPTFPTLVLNKKLNPYLPHAPSEIHKMFGLVRRFNTPTPENEPDEPRVAFDTDFECANAEMIYQKKKNEFHVFMRSDTNGQSNLQWFAFRMRNAPDFLGQIRIVIVNFTKSKSLFNRVSRVFLTSTLIRACNLRSSRRKLTRVKEKNGFKGGLTSLTQRASTPKK